MLNVSCRPIRCPVNACRPPLVSCMQILQARTPLCQCVVTSRDPAGPYAVLSVCGFILGALVGAAVLGTGVCAAVAAAGIAGRRQRLPRLGGLLLRRTHVRSLCYTVLWSTWSSFGTTCSGLCCWALGCCSLPTEAP